MIQSFRSAYNSIIAVLTHVVTLLSILFLIYCMRTPKDRLRGKASIRQDDLLLTLSLIFLSSIIGISCAQPNGLRQTKWYVHQSGLTAGVHKGDGRKQPVEKGGVRRNAEKTVVWMSYTKELYEWLFLL